MVLWLGKESSRELSWRETVQSYARPCCAACSRPTISHLQERVIPLHEYYLTRAASIAGITAESLASDASHERRFAAYLADDEPWDVPSGIDTHDLSVPGPHGDIPVRTYTPVAGAAETLIWVHGGGFFAGGLDWAESHVVSAELAARASVRVVAVDYRLAGPGVRYPVPLDDVDAVLGWARQGRERERLHVGGASAGGALALAASLRHPELVSQLLLAYPFVHFPVPALEEPMATEILALPPLLRFTPQSIEGMVENYVGRRHSLPPDALPGAAPVSPNGPALHIVIDEYDDLRPSAELLARQYTEAGRTVRTRLELGVPHGHLNRRPGAAGVDASLQWFADALIAARPSGPVDG